MADKEHQAKVILATAAILEQNRVSKNNFSELIKLYRESTCIDPAVLEAKYSVFMKGFTAIQSKSTIESYIHSSGYEIEDDGPSIDVIVVNNESGTREELHTYPDTFLRDFIDFYKNMVNMPSSQGIRLKYMGKTIFLSSSANKTLEELNIRHRSFITVTEIQPPQHEITKPKKEKKQPKPHNKNTSKSKGGKKSKKKRSNKCSYDNMKKIDDHQIHSKRLSLVFDEAGPTFKEIRQRISNLSLKNTSKKSAKRDKTAILKEKSTNVCNPTLDGIGGKAGKALFNILAGNTDQLYQTSKKSTKNIQRTLSIDLHGFTGDEATKKLDLALIEWVDIAMRGSNPFVVPVKIVCGCGNQVISEVVEKWIRTNSQVAHRPKSFC